MRSAAMSNEQRAMSDKLLLIACMLSEGREKAESLRESELVYEIGRPPPSPRRRTGILTREVA